MNNLSLYLGEKMIEELARGTGPAFYRPGYLVPKVPRLAEQPEVSTGSRCHCMQVKLARRTMVRVELCG